jgi:predicted XRE-type DNA-binding protein
MTKVQKGSSNVFDDLGFDDAEDLQAEAVLADQIYVILKELGISQRAAAELLGIDQSDVSRLMKGRYTGFSLRRLMTLLNRLDRDVELVVKRHRGRGKAGLTVRAR